jgi:hypothetical protein
MQHESLQELRDGSSREAVVWCQADTYNAQSGRDAADMGGQLTHVLTHAVPAKQHLHHSSLAHRSHLLT